MPRKAKKAVDDFWSETIDSPNDDYGFPSGYEDPLEYMTPEQIALLADYCNYLKAHDGYDPDNYEDVILEKERQLFGKGNNPPPLYPDESEEDEGPEEDEEPEEEEEEEPDDEEIEENENNEDDNNEEN